MKHTLLLGLLTGLLCFGACKDDDPAVATTDFTITFKAQYGGQPLEMYKKYDYDTYQVLFTRFNTFLANIRLIQNGAPVQLSEIEWVDFTPSGSSNNLALDVPITFKNVKEGDYTGIQIGYGVPANLNAKKPSDFPVGDPLTLENEYWLGWGSYIFNKIEGLVYLNPDDTFDGGLTYHCGSDAVYRTYDFLTPIKVGSGASLTVVFDLKTLFENSGSAGGWLDLHDPYNQFTSNEITDVVIATQLMNQFGKATTVQQ